MKIGIIRSSLVYDLTPYFLGVSAGSKQIRLGLIWWHVVVMWS